MDKRHSGKVAVITGGAVGIGRAYAVRMASEGADVAIVDLNDSDESVAAAREVAGNNKIAAFKCDVSSPEQVSALGDAVEAEFGRCDILVNNAGIFPACPFGDMTYDIWKRMLSVNLDSIFLMSHRFLPGMRERKWGRVINMASNTFGQVAPGLTHYIASKGGVIGFTRALASEMGNEGITVNAIAPGFTKTEGTLNRPPNFAGHTSEQLYTMLASRQSINRVPMPEDLVGAMSFLASDDSAFMTAQTLYVDGGMVRA